MAGVSGVVVDGNRLHCQVAGPMEPLLERLSGERVDRLVSREPSLEELFMAHYGDVPA